MDVPPGAKYEAIADDLRQRIESGALAPGEQLPSERQLAAQHKVSTMTVRQAFAALANEGLVVLRPSRRHLVRDYRRIVSRRLQRLSARQWASGAAVWDADTTAVGRDFRQDPVVVEEVAPPARVARALRLPEGGTAWQRSRRFWVDGRLVQTATSWYPAAVVAGSPITRQDTGPGGAPARLADLGHAPVEWVERVIARMPSRDEREALQLPAGTPVLCISRVGVDGGGLPVEHTEMTLDAAAYELTYEWSDSPS